MVISMERIMAFVILAVAVFSAALVSVSEGKAFEKNLGQYGHLDTRYEGLENDGGRDDLSAWDAVADDVEPQQQVLAISGGELIRLLLQQQAKARKQPNPVIGAIGSRNGPEYNTQISGISGARNKKRQILYRQCFFNPISCF